MVGGFRRSVRMSRIKKCLEKELLVSVVSCNLQFFINLSLVDYLGLSPYVPQSCPPPGLPMSIPPSSITASPEESKSLLGCLCTHGK